ncbi:MAG: choice-of-anchor Q domain-containing protein [Limisphaerales bacterium]
MFALLPSESLRAAGPFTVTTSSDTHAVNAAASPNDSGAQVSLRSAIEAANAQSGATIINVPPGTYNLTLGELAVAPNGGKTNTIISSGTAANTIVSQTDPNNRVFNIDVNSLGGTSVRISGITIQGGHDHADNLGGAGILAGSITSLPLDNLSLTNCVIVNNHCTPPNTNYTAQPGGGIQMSGGNLTLTGCTFSNNTSAASLGGAIAFISPTLVSGGSGGTLTITNSLFANNRMTNTSTSGPDGAGAIYINTTIVAAHNIRNSTFSGNTVRSLTTGNVVGGAIDLNTGTLNINTCTFTTNSVIGGVLQAGGAIYTDSGTLNVVYSRFKGNTAAGGGSAIFNHTANSATTIAENDWWASNTGPGAAISGFSVVSWLKLNHFANLNSIAINGSTTLLATFTTNSTGSAIAPANLSLLLGMPVSFDNAALGIISGAQTTIQNSGMATATFTAGGAGGTGSADATVDGAVATALISILASNLNVVNTNDSGAGSLRQAIANLSPGGTIAFDPSLAGKTIYLTSGELLLTKNSTINGLGANQLTISGNRLGRVLDIAPGTTNMISGLTIADGLANAAIPNPNLGGGIYNGGDLTLINCAIRGNSATNTSSGWGGGIYSTNIVRLIGCIVGPTNQAGLVGGGVYAHFSSTLQMLNCTVVSNTSSFQGGGVVANTGAIVSLTNCTVTGNSDTSLAGGYGSVQSPQFKNTIIAGNTSSAGGAYADIYTFGSPVLSLGHNLIGITNVTMGWLPSDLAGNTNSPLNARLGPLANNGGPTLTCALLLVPNSPALNAGDNSSAPPFDQRGSGFPRITGGTIDIGAFELVPPTLSVLRLPAKIALLWPTNTAGYALESTTNLSLPTVWIPAGVPAIVGSQYAVTNNAVAGKQFFRLNAH